MHRGLLITALTVFAVVGACDDDEVTNPDPTGAVEVSATTAGTGLDPDGYEARLTEDIGGIPEPADQPLTVNGSTTFTQVPPGEYVVELAEVDMGCIVEGQNPREIEVTADETTDVDFTVNCEAPSGVLEVTVSTTGDTPDPDGYTIDIGPESATVSANASSSFTELSEGEYVVELTGVAENCTVAGDNPRTVEVLEDQTTETTFDVDCPAPQT